MRFLLDEDVHPAVAEIGRGLGLDVESVHEINRRGHEDLPQLEFAAASGRALVTRNRDDYIKLTVSFFRSGSPHAGVIIVPYSLPNREPARIAHALKRWHEEHPHDEGMGYAIFFLGA